MSRKYTAFGIIFLGALLLIALTPYVIGSLFRRSETKIYEAFSARFSDQFEQHILYWHQGWLSSDVEYSIEPKASYWPKLSNYPHTLVVKIHVQHGPFVFDPTTNHWRFAFISSQSKLHLPDQLNAYLTIALGQSPEFIINEIMTFDGHDTDQVTIPAMQGKLSDNSSYQWDGFSGTFLSVYSLIHPEKVHIDANLSVGAFQITANSKAKLALSPISLQSTSVIDLNDVKSLQEAQGVVNIPELSITDEKNNQVTIKGFSISNQFSSSPSSQFNSTTRMSINELKTPEWALTAPSSFEIDLNNINYDALIDLNKLIQAEKEPDPQTAITAILLIFAPDSSINTHANVNTNYGNLDYTGNIHWTNTSPPQSPNELIPATQAQLHVNVPISVVEKSMPIFSAMVAKKYLDKHAAEKNNEAEVGAEKLPSLSELTKAVNAVYKKQLDALIKQGYVKIDKDHYVTDIQFVNGSLQANGVQIQLGQQ